MAPRISSQPTVRVQALRVLKVVQSEFMYCNIVRMLGGDCADGKTDVPEKIS